MNVTPKGIPEGCDCCSPWQKIMERIRAITTELSTTVKKVEVNGSQYTPTGAGVLTLPDYPEPEHIIIDDELSTISENPVQNKVITIEVNSLDARVESLEDDVPVIGEAVVNIASDITDSIKPDILNLEGAVQDIATDIETNVKPDIETIETDLETNVKPDISALETTVAGKQDTLTAGTNITIDANNVISASGGDTKKHYVQSGSGFYEVSAPQTLYTRAEFLDIIQDHYDARESYDITVGARVYDSASFFTYGNKRFEYSLEDGNSRKTYYWLIMEQTTLESSYDSGLTPEVVLSSGTNVTIQAKTYTEGQTMASGIVSSNYSGFEVFFGAPTSIVDLVKQKKAHFESKNGAVNLVADDTITVPSSITVKYRRAITVGTTVTTANFTRVHLYDNSLSDASEKVECLIHTQGTAVDLNDLQPKLTAGTNITIDANNVISASGGGGGGGKRFITHDLGLATFYIEDAETGDTYDETEYFDVLDELYESGAGFTLVVNGKDMIPWGNRTLSGAKYIDLIALNPSSDGLSYYTSSAVQNWRMSGPFSVTDRIAYETMHDYFYGNKTLSAGQTLTSFSGSSGAIFFRVPHDVREAIDSGKLVFTRNASNLFIKATDTVSLVSGYIYYRYLDTKDISNTNVMFVFIADETDKIDTNQVTVINPYLLDKKQDKLTAGTNITIVDNVISASGGGGGTITQFDLPADFETAMKSSSVGDTLAIEWLTLADDTHTLAIAGFSGTMSEPDSVTNNHIFAGCGTGSYNGNQVIISQIYWKPGRTTFWVRFGSDNPISMPYASVSSARGSIKG